MSGILIGASVQGRGPLVFSYLAGDDLAAKGATFTRGSFASYTAYRPTVFAWLAGDSLAGATFSRGGTATYTALRGETPSVMGTAKILTVTGQSNALSLNTVGQPYTGGEIDPERVKIWNGRAFVGYVPGVNSEPNGNYPTAWGPEAEFARLWCLDNPDEILWIVKYAYGATQLYKDGSASIDWHPDSKGEHFEGMAAFMRNAQAYLISQNLKPDVIANIWVQGERDAADSAAAAEYEVNLTYEILASRTRWLAPTAKWMINRNTYAGAYNATVRAAQEAVAAADANVYLLNSDVYPTDGTHYYPAGIIQMGADAYGSYTGSYVYP